MPIHEYTINENSIHELSSGHDVLSTQRRPLVSAMRYASQLARPVSWLPRRYLRISIVLFICEVNDESINYRCRDQIANSARVVRRRDPIIVEWLPHILIDPTMIAVHYAQLAARQHRHSKRYKQPVQNILVFSLETIGSYAKMQTIIPSLCVNCVRLLWWNFHNRVA